MKKISKKIIDEIIRVNHAGEYGAQRIYSGQLRFCKKKDLKKKLQSIIDEEYVHYKYFDDIMIKKRSRPTIMSPLWHHGGYLLGAMTSLMGEKYVHACTEAVEEVIVEHYNDQIKLLEKEKVEQDLLKKIKKFSAEEDEHRHFAEQSNTNKKGVKFFKKITKKITRVAIRVSKKV